MYFIFAKFDDKLNQKYLYILRTVIFLYFIEQNCSETMLHIFEIFMHLYRKVLN